MKDYYKENLNAQKMYHVYDTQIPRIKQYLKEEIDYVRKNISKSHKVLELGAGYGRIVKELAPYCKSIVGIDTARESVDFGKTYLKGYHNASMVLMDVKDMEFSNLFDCVLCLQNGLSAMHIDMEDIYKILNFVDQGGTAYFSSYSEKFWEFRLKWFEEQSKKGLLGEIDYLQTKNGIIICKDGFKAVTHTPKEFSLIGKEIGYPFEVLEVDESSLFLIIHKV
ncbi:MAG: class I SAM-dependent methyltransferase [Aminipila sp.]